MSPNKKDVINVTQLGHWFVFLIFKEICLYSYIPYVYGDVHLVPIAVPNNC